MIDLLTKVVDDIYRVKLLPYVDFSNRINSVIEHRYRLQRLFS